MSTYTPAPAQLTTLAFRVGSITSGTSRRRIIGNHSEDLLDWALVGNHTEGLLDDLVAAHDASVAADEN